MKNEGDDDFFLEEFHVPNFEQQEQDRIAKLSGNNNYYKEYGLIR